MPRAPQAGEVGKLMPQAEVAGQNGHKAHATQTARDARNSQTPAASQRLRGSQPVCQVSCLSRWAKQSGQVKQAMALAEVAAAKARAGMKSRRGGGIPRPTNQKRCDAE